VRVFLQGRQRAAGRDGEAQLLEHRRGGDGRARARGRRRLAAPHELDQRVFHFSRQDAVGAPVQQLVRVQRSVVTEEADVRRRVEDAHTLGRGHADAQRGVHGDADGHDARALDLLGVQRLDRQIEHGGGIARALQEGGGPGDRQRLVAQLVAGDQEDLAGGAHPVLSVPPCYREPDSNSVPRRRRAWQ
jgi:hypothetical protein